MIYSFGQLNGIKSSLKGINWEEYISKKLEEWVQIAEKPYLDATNEHNSKILNPVYRNSPIAAIYVNLIAQLKEVAEKHRADANGFKTFLKSPDQFVDNVISTLRKTISVGFGNQEYKLQTFNPSPDKLKEILKPDEEKFLAAFEDKDGIYVLDGLIDFLAKKDALDDKKRVASLIGNAGVELYLLRNNIDPTLAHNIAEDFEKLIYGVSLEAESPLNKDIIEFSREKLKEISTGIIISPKTEPGKILLTPALPDSKETETTTEPTDPEKPKRKSYYKPKPPRFSKNGIRLGRQPKTKPQEETITEVTLKPSGDKEEATTVKEIPSQTIEIVQTPEPPNEVEIKEEILPKTPSQTIEIVQTPEPPNEVEIKEEKIEAASEIKLIPSDGDLDADTLNLIRTLLRNGVITDEQAIVLKIIGHDSDFALQIQSSNSFQVIENRLANYRNNENKKLSDISEVLRGKLKNHDNSLARNLSEYIESLPKHAEITDEETIERWLNKKYGDLALHRTNPIGGITFPDARAKYTPNENIKNKVSEIIALIEDAKEKNVLSDEEYSVIRALPTNYPDFGLENVSFFNSVDRKVLTEITKKLIKHYRDLFTNIEQELRKEENTFFASKLTNTKNIPEPSSSLRNLSTATEIDIELLQAYIYNHNQDLLSTLSDKTSTSASDTSMFFEKSLATEVEIYDLSKKESFSKKLEEYIKIYFDLLVSEDTFDDFKNEMVSEIKGEQGLSNELEELYEKPIENIVLEKLNELQIDEQGWKIYKLYREVSKDRSISLTEISAKLDLNRFDVLTKATKTNKLLEKHSQIRFQKEAWDPRKIDISELISSNNSHEAKLAKAYENYVKAKGVPPTKNEVYKISHLKDDNDFNKALAELNILLNQNGYGDLVLYEGKELCRKIYSESSKENIHFNDLAHLLKEDKKVISSTIINLKNENAFNILKQFDPGFESILGNLQIQARKFEELYEAELLSKHITEDHINLSKIGLAEYITNRANILDKNADSYHENLISHLAKSVEIDRSLITEEFLGSLGINKKDIEVAYHFWSISNDEVKLSDLYEKTAHFVSSKKELLEALDKLESFIEANNPSTNKIFITDFDNPKINEVIRQAYKKELEFPSNSYSDFLSRLSQNKHIKSQNLSEEELKLRLEKKLDLGEHEWFIAKIVYDLDKTGDEISFNTVTQAIARKNGATPKDIFSSPEEKIQEILDTVCTILEFKNASATSQSPTNGKSPYRRIISISSPQVSAFKFYNHRNPNGSNYAENELPRSMGDIHLIFASLPTSDLRNLMSTYGLIKKNNIEVEVIYLDEENKQKTEKQIVTRNRYRELYGQLKKDTKVLVS